MNDVDPCDVPCHSDVVFDFRNSLDGIFLSDTTCSFKLHQRPQTIVDSASQTIYHAFYLSEKLISIYTHADYNE